MQYRIPEGVLKTLDVDLGIYQDAIKNERTMTAELEALDPSDNYKDIPGLAKTDAFQRQLLARQINVKSAQMSVFFDEDKRAFFPEFVNRQLMLAKEVGKNEIRVEDIVAVKSQIAAGTYRAPKIEMPDGNLMRNVGEKAKFPVVSITLDDREIKLKKFATSVQLTYEVARRTSIPLYQNALKLIGTRWEQQKAALLLTVAAASGCATSSDTELTYKVLKDMVIDHAPWDVTHLITDKAGIKSILDMSEFKDQNTGAKFQETGAFATPFGAFLKVFSGSDPDLTNKVVGIDSSFAMEMVTEKGASMIEYDQIKNGQWTEMDISEVIGFSRIHDEACRVLTITPAE